MIKKLSIDIAEDHSAFLWAKKQSDSVNAIGHIGTHIDCYSNSPSESIFELDTVVIDCLNRMPIISDIENLNIEGKAIILYTGVLNKYGYGSVEYGQVNTFLLEPVLDEILKSRPKFILIDSCGIGNHGNEHITFDKKCEKENCFVIENIFLDDQIASSIKRIKIEVDIDSKSTGKPCNVYAII